MPRVRLYQFPSYCQRDEDISVVMSLECGSSPMAGVKNEANEGIIAGRVAFL